MDVATPSGLVRRVLASTLWSSLALLAVVLPLYLAFTVPADQINVDAEPAAMPAWHLVQHGTVDLRGFDTNDNPFIGATDTGRVMSNRPLALSLVAVPAYLLTDDTTYSPDPSSVTAALVTATSVLVLHLVLRRCAPPGWALGGTLVFALGTATWPISATQLWPHGPGQLVGALVLLALSSRRALPAGLAAGVGVLLRPVTAVVPFVLALVAAWQRRWAAAVALAAPAVVALAGVVAYNDWAFGRPTLSGGYGAGFGDRLQGQSPLEYLGNVVDMSVSPQNGLFFWSPIVLVACVGLPSVWRDLPEWARQGAVAGLAYLLVHLRLNRASGGLPYDYRYPLESLALALPALVLGTRALVARRAWGQRAVVLGVGISLLLQGAVATTFECEEPAEPGADAICSLL